MNRRLALLSALTPTLLQATLDKAYAQASSQNFPNKPIRLIVPNPAGGLPDTVGRIFAQRLSERLGQPVVIDNKPGANGVLAAQAIATAPKDGHTLILADATMFSINPWLYKNLGYDYKRDFAPVAFAARAPLYLALHPKMGVNSFSDWVALVKSKPNTFSYGSSGVGSIHHLTMESLKAALNLDIQHVPFKGTGQSVPALIGGQVDMLFSALPSLSGFVKTGQVRLVANNAIKRSAQEPQVPTVAETLAGFDFAPIIGLFAASGTPTSAIERISAEMAAVSQMPSVQEQLHTNGIEAVGGNHLAFGRAVLDEITRYGKAVNVAGLKPE